MYNGGISKEFVEVFRKLLWTWVRFPSPPPKAYYRTELSVAKPKGCSMLLMGVPRLDMTVSIKMENRQSSRKNYKLNANDNKFALAA